MEKACSKGKEGGRSLVLGVLLLSVAHLLVKVFGFLYKVPLNRVLGDEMANVNAAYAVYTLLYMISTAGIPVAVSVLISEARARGQGSVMRILRVSLLTLAAVGAAGTAALVALAGPISRANSGGDSYLCLLGIAPALFFVCLSSVLRGYFQGLGNLRPTAVSGVIEAFGKMALGLLFVRLVLTLPSGDTHLAAGYSVFGITVGIALGTLYLFIEYAIACRRSSFALPLAGEEGSGRAILWRLIKVAVPIALGSAVMSLSSLVDSQLMRPLLAAHYGDQELAKAVFSDYSTGAVTLFNMPAILIYPITAAIVPYITAARTEGRLADATVAVASALRTAALVSLPAAFGMSALAGPILSFVFVGDGDMATHAGAPLSILALSIFPLAMLAVTNAVLQAYGRSGRPVLSMLFGVLIKILSLCLLTGSLGALAAPLGTLLFYLGALLLNAYFIWKDTPLRLELFSLLAAPAAGGALSAIIAFLLHTVAAPLPGALALLLAIGAAVLVYIPTVLLLGGIRPEDFLLIPKGDRLLRLLKKYKLIRKKELPK